MSAYPAPSTPAVHTPESVQAQIAQTPSPRRFFSSFIEEAIYIQLSSAYRRGHELPPIVLLSVNKSLRKLALVNDMTMAEAFRKEWTCQPLSQPRPPVVAICHDEGKIIKVYKDLVWARAHPETSKSWQFTGNEAPELMKCWGSLDLSDQLTQPGMANPVRYVNCHKTIPIETILTTTARPGDPTQWVKVEPAFANQPIVPRRPRF